MSVSVMWVADTPQPVPGWVVALAVLAGLLLLALLIFIMYKVRNESTHKFYLGTSRYRNVLVVFRHTSCSYVGPFSRNS